ncbi:MAG TPA: histidine kinase [Flavobacteriales bacterium]|nr:histidine kinase [Flavobacteriales bacterium]
MQIFYRWPFFLICLLCSLPAQANTDTAGINRLNNLSVSASHSNLEKSIAYARKALARSQKSGYTQGRFEALINLGNAYYYKFDFNTAMRYYLQACRIGEKKGYKQGLCECYYSIGKMNRQQGNYKQALAFSRKGLTLAIHLNDSAAVSSLLNGMGNIFGHTKQYDSAMHYFRKRLDLETGRGKKESIASIRANIGSLFGRQNQTDSAMHYLLKAETLVQGSPLFEKDREFRKFVGGLYSLIAGLSRKKNQHSKAEDYALKSYALVVKDSAKKEMMETCRLLASLYEEKNDYKKAHSYLEQYTRLKDMVFKEENTRQFAEMSTKYETEKKEQQLKIKTISLQRERQRSAYILAAWAVSVVFVLLTGWFLYYRYKLKQQNRFETALRNQQKLRYKAVIDAQEQEKKRIAAELHDSLGQQLAIARLSFEGIERENAPHENELFLKHGLNMLDTAASEVRNISHQMMPSALIKIGMVEAIQELASKVNFPGKIKLVVENKLPSNFDPGQEITINLYRIVQELTGNLVKHSMANSALLQLSVKENMLKMFYSDNGKGLSLTELDAARGIGWKNTLSRIEFMEGKLN